MQSIADAEVSVKREGAVIKTHFHRKDARLVGVTGKELGEKQKPIQTRRHEDTKEKAEMMTTKKYEARAMAQ